MGGGLTMHSALEELVTSALTRSTNINYFKPI
jgi:hypothetical protein